jgi:uncharacterized protein YhdP
MRRWLRVALLLIGVPVAVVALGAGAVVWRVRQGPVSLGFLVPRIEAALAQDDAGWTVDVDALELVWETAERHVELQARGLQIVRRNDMASIKLDEVRIRLQRRALLRGQIVVTAIEVDGPVLRLVRDVEGRFALELGGPGARRPGTESMWAFFERIEHIGVRDGQVTFVDEPSGTTWNVPNVDGDAWHAGGPIRVQVGLSLGAGTTAIPIWCDGLYRIDAGRLTLDVSSPGADAGAAFAAWPRTLAPEAHAWVTSNLTGGHLRQSTLALSAHVVHEEDWKIVVDGLDATVGFEGITVRYLNSMPPVTGVAGTARFTSEDLKVTTTAGKLDALAVVPATVHVAWPPGAPNRLAVDARVSGPLANLLGVLDNEPVGLGRRVTLPSRGVSGTTTTRVRLAFPLAGRPVLGKLGLHATSTITDATVPYVSGDWGIARGNGTVVVDDRTVAIDGTADVRGVPVTLRVRDQLMPPRSQRIELTARLEPGHRAALGIDTGTWLTGVVAATVRIAPTREGRSVADVDVDLGEAAIDLPSLALRKAPAAPGRALGRVALARGVATAVEHFDVNAAGVTVRGSAGRPPGGGAWNRIDAGATFALPDRPDDGAALQLALRSRAPAASGWRATLTTRDLGLVLRAYGYPQARGGRMTLDGTMELRDGVPFDGQLTIENVTLTGVPWLVKAVSLASLRGLLNLGSEQVVVIDRAVATVAHRPPSILELTDAVARGPTLGLNLSGRVDLDADTLALDGTLVPSYYMLNEGASSIPIVGGLLGRVTGGALQAVTFTVSGSRNDPVVSVKPLSSLAPGALRDWLRKLGL